MLLTYICILISSNRTFMELKYYKGVAYSTITDVLIVPLWNWNEMTMKVLTQYLSSNRTFMELKFDALIHSLWENRF